MTRNRHQPSITKSNDPLVSIIVPTYNRELLLGRTLNSLMVQSYNSIEVIVVNDGGEDVHKTVHKLNDDRFKYIQNDKNSGASFSRNVGMRNATGDYLCFLDDDDIYLPHAIEFRMHMMKKLNAEIVYTRALLDQWEIKDNSYVSKQKTLYWDSPFNSLNKDLILIQNVAPCCCPLFSRKAWEKADYWFDETMVTTEDHDFWIALSRKTDFEDLRLIDCECSRRPDKTQATGNLNFTSGWIKTFKRWRHTALSPAYVIEHQNNILKSVGIDPKEHGL